MDGTTYGEVDDSLLNDVFASKELFRSDNRARQGSGVDVPARRRPIQKNVFEGYGIVVGPCVSLSQRHALGLVNGCARRLHTPNGTSSFEDRNAGGVAAAGIDACGSAHEEYSPDNS